MAIYALENDRLRRICGDFTSMASGTARHNHWNIIPLPSRERDERVDPQITQIDTDFLLTKVFNLRKSVKSVDDLYLASFVYFVPGPI